MLPKKELEYVGKGLKKIKKKNLDEYYKSKHWQTVRRARKMQHNIECEICGDDEKKTPKHLHHSTYKNLGDELGCDLKWLCEDCHEEVHTYVKCFCDGEDIIILAERIMKNEQEAMYLSLENRKLKESNDEYIDRIVELESSQSKDGK